MVVLAACGAEHVGATLEGVGEMIRDAGRGLAADAAAQGTRELAQPCDTTRPDGQATRHYAVFDVDPRDVAHVWGCDSETTPPGALEGVECRSAVAQLVGGRVWVDCGADPATRWHEARLTLR